MSRAARAVFVDKDGTLVPNMPNNADPARITLAPGAGPALAKLRAAGYAIALASNQGGIAHGLFRESDLDRVWWRVRTLLSPFGVSLDGIYYCPHAPEDLCRCRKPKPGLLLRAAAEHGYDLARSWMIGDILDDVEAGNRAGCRTILLNAGNETEWRRGPFRQPTYVARDLPEASRFILRGEGRPGRVAFARTRSNSWTGTAA